jgi:hypothetical protein
MAEETGQEKLTQEDVNRMLNVLKALQHTLTGLYEIEISKNYLEDIPSSARIITGILAGTVRTTLNLLNSEIQKIHDIFLDYRRCNIVCNMQKVPVWGIVKGHPVKDVTRIESYKLRTDWIISICCPQIIKNSNLPHEMKICFILKIGKGDREIYYIPVEEIESIELTN